MGNLDAVVVGLSLLMDLRSIGLGVTSCGLSDEGMIILPRGPDFGNLVLLLNSVSVVV